MAVTVSPPRSARRPASGSLTGGRALTTPPPPPPSPAQRAVQKQRSPPPPRLETAADMGVTRGSDGTENETTEPLHAPPAEERHLPPPRRRRWPRLQRRYVFVIGLLLLATVGLLVAQLVHHVSSAYAAPVRREPPDPQEPLPSSGSVEHHFQRAAVCSDGAPCSAVGSDILLRNGSVIDAAIATLLCNGIVNCQSMGLGGGFLMTLYLHEEQKIVTLNAREMAPYAIKPDVYFNDRTKSRHGPLASGVPGELKGYWEAHKKYGKLPWKDVVAPAAKICKDGYLMTKHQSDSLDLYKNHIRKDPHLRSIFFDEFGKQLHAGDLVKHGKLCETLDLIAQRGGDDLYTGELAKLFASDVQKMGGLLTQEDMRSYRVKWDDPVSVTLKTGETVYSVPPPGSGALLIFMLSVLDKYNFTKDSVSSINATTLTYHRIIETFKFAFARRGEMGDPRFVNTTRLVDELISPEYVTHIKNQILDNTTWQNPQKYGAVSLNQDDHGTAHVSIIGLNGDAVAITSTINLYFGASVASENTGIILNSVMDDFSNANYENYFGLPWSPANSIQPGKQPVSSMSPTIILDKERNVRLVIGASGGTKIPTAIAYVITRHLWFGESVKESVDSSRFHHQLYPMRVNYEYGILDPVLRGLEKIGHVVKRYRDRGSIICAIAVQNNSIIANADYRKGGDVYGLD